MMNNKIKFKRKSVKGVIMPLSLSGLSDNCIITGISLNNFIFFETKKRVPYKIDLEMIDLKDFSIDL